MLLLFYDYSPKICPIPPTNRSTYASGCVWYYGHIRRGDRFGHFVWHSSHFWVPNRRALYRHTHQKPHQNVSSISYHIRSHSLVIAHSAIVLYMKLTVLADSNTFIDHYFLGEPGVSYFIEADGKRILYDVSYSDVFIQNAQKLRIDLLDLDYLVISHGHLDHMWGLDPLLKLYSQASLEGLGMRKPTLIVHPKTFFFRPRTYLGGSGPLVSEDRVAQFFTVQKIEEPLWLTENLVCLPNIPKSNDFELKTPFKQIRIDNQDVDDYMEDEIALAYKSADGLIVSNACSHRGICNTLEYAKSVCQEDRIADIICGLHLQNPDKTLLDSTVAYFAQNPPTSMHPCHCTDLQSKIALSKVANVQEVGSGLRLEYA